MAGRRSRGFSMVEVLTAIAIIAIIAAILFPVFSRVREGARQGTCMSNLHQIYVALEGYRQDMGGAPPTLMGFAERPDGTLATSPADPHVNADRVLHGYLYSRKQVFDPAVFQCPNNGADGSALTLAHYPPRPAGWVGPWIGETLAGVCGTDAFGTIACWADNPAHPPMVFYASDSYSITPRVDTAGQPVTGPGGAVVYDLAYSPDWTGVSGPADKPNQLKYPNPPADRTLVASCNQHVIAGSEQVMAISLAGTARKVPASQMLEKGPGIFAP